MPMHETNLNQSRSDTVQKQKTCYDTGCDVTCFSWSAVIVGALVGLGLGFLLNLFGVAIGLAAYKTTEEGVMALAVSGFIGMVIAAMIVAFVAGWVSGLLGRAFCVNRALGSLYGFATWTLMLILSVLLASSAGEFLSNHVETFTNPKSATLRITTSSAEDRTENTRKADTQAANRKANTANDEKNAKLLGKSLLLVFILFFVSALSACYGGYVAMFRCRRTKE